MSKEYDADLIIRLQARIEELEAAALQIAEDCAVCPVQNSARLIAKLKAQHKQLEWLVKAVAQFKASAELKKE